ncbi:vesicle-associated membrane protein 5 isoform X2 [Podarcis raffonei]|uniref:vesicle-associated membrane protein 5 isoform X2 n=1 Tax=Podarcis raffonei TaxID=65483 RepID=UPI002329362B|nr:vesicle-associated membrane protein 5 isoform X2 [Podarcis raffonei]
MGENNLKRCQGEAEQVTEIMLENYNKVLDREGKLSKLDERADELRNQSAAFSKTTGTVARQMRWKNMKWKVILVGVVAGVIILILAIVLYFTLPSSANMDTPAKAGGGP